jgi:hypothetical protein
MSNTADVTGGKPIAVWSQSKVKMLLIALYDIHGRKSAILLFFPGHHTRLKKESRKRLYKFALTSIKLPLWLRITPYRVGRLSLRSHWYMIYDITAVKVLCYCWGNLGYSKHWLFYYCVQSRTHRTIHFGLCTALISRALELLSKCKCVASCTFVLFSWREYKQEVLKLKGIFAANEF